MRTIVWYRHKDLRVSDHEPLLDAAATGEVIPLVVLEADGFSPARPPASPHPRQFHLECLHSLAGNLRELGSELVCATGSAADVLERAVSQWKADRVLVHRLVEPKARGELAQVEARIGERLIAYEGETLQPPGTIRNREGSPFAVFTHFHRAFRELAQVDAPRRAPKELPPLPQGKLEARVELPSLDAPRSSRAAGPLLGGERAARERLRAFVRNDAQHYPALRDRMDRAGTSRLSADLKFGALSVREVYRAVERALGDSNAGACFTRQLVWREFAYSTLFDRPELTTEPFRPEFTGFPWRDDEELWSAWVEGKTGYPLVDAAARQLRSEGFVHNRARMISASFLCKHLMLPYSRGEAHYLDCLVDGDLAQNNLGWQWSAGCGCDAQPYFRVFNPELQGKKFDPDGEYVRRWVPELARLDARFIHAPERTSARGLDDAGIQLGRDYPRPIVEHGAARARFLELARQHLAGARGVNAKPGPGSPAPVSRGAVSRGAVSRGRARADAPRPARSSVRSRGAR